MTRFLALLILAPAIAFGQSTTLRITNATPALTVPILSGSAPIIDNQGNIYLQCQLQPSLGICEGLSTPVSGTAPTLTFSRSGSGDLAVGASTTLTWASGNSPELCYATSTPVTSDWNGAKALNSSQSISFTSAGAKALNLKCYNNSGAGPERTVIITVAGATAPTGGCNVVKSEIADTTQRALFQPDGFTQVDKTWPGTFGVDYSFPETFSDFYPVGSWTLAGLSYSAVSTRGKYISIAFTGNGNPLQLQWNSAKPLSFYAPARFASSVYVTLTACPGDFRIAGTFQYTSPDPVNDPSFVAQCRSTNTSEALLSYGPSAMSYAFCPVESGRLYYINIVFANVLDGLSTSETGCSNTSTAVCDISVKNRPTF